MDHKKLDVWKLALDFVVKIYSASNDFPNHELYGLANQMRKAAVSVPSNIAEGSARNSDKEMLQFLHVSLGSLAEIETQVIIAHRLEYIQNMEELNSDVQNLRKLLTGLIKYIKSKSH